MAYRGKDYNKQFQLRSIIGDALKGITSGVGGALVSNIPSFLGGEKGEKELEPTEEQLARILKAESPLPGAEITNTALSDSIRKALNDPITRLKLGGR